MATIIHIGHHRVITLAGSDGSVIPPAGIVATADSSGILSASVNPVNGQVTVTGLIPGGSSITYSAPGYTTAVEMFSVSPLPTIVPTDGPEI